MGRTNYLRSASGRCIQKSNSDDEVKRYLVCRSGRDVSKSSSSSTTSSRRLKFLDKKPPSTAIPDIRNSDEMFNISKLIGQQSLAEQTVFYSRHDGQPGHCYLIQRRSGSDKDSDECDCMPGGTHQNRLTLNQLGSPCTAGQTFLIRRCSDQRTYHRLVTSPRPKVSSVSTSKIFRRHIFRREAEEMAATVEILADEVNSSVGTTGGETFVNSETTTVDQSRSFITASGFRFFKMSLRVSDTESQTVFPRWRYERHKERERSRYHHVSRERSNTPEKQNPSTAFIFKSRSYIKKVDATTTTDSPGKTSESTQNTQRTINSTIGTQTTSETQKKTYSTKGTQSRLQFVEVSDKTDNTEGSTPAYNRSEVLENVQKTIENQGMIMGDDGIIKTSEYDASKEHKVSVEVIPKSPGSPSQKDQKKDASKEHKVSVEVIPKPPGSPSQKYQKKDASKEHKISVEVIPKPPGSPSQKNNSSLVCKVSKESIRKSPEKNNEQLPTDDCGLPEQQSDGVLITYKRTVEEVENSPEPQKGSSPVSKEQIRKSPEKHNKGSSLVCKVSKESIRKSPEKNNEELQTDDCWFPEKQSDGVLITFKRTVEEVSRNSPEPQKGSSPVSKEQIRKSPEKHNKGSSLVCKVSKESIRKSPEKNNEELQTDDCWFPEKQSDGVLITFKRTVEEVSRNSPEPQKGSSPVRKVSKEQIRKSPEKYKKGLSPVRKGSRERNRKSPEKFKKGLSPVRKGSRERNRKSPEKFKKGSSPECKPSKERFQKSPERPKKGATKKRSSSSERIRRRSPAKREVPKKVDAIEKYIKKCSEHKELNKGLSRKSLEDVSRLQENRGISRKSYENIQMFQEKSGASKRSSSFECIPKSSVDKDQQKPDYLSVEHIPTLTKVISTKDVVIIRHLTRPSESKESELSIEDEEMTSSEKNLSMRVETVGSRKLQLHRPGVPFPALKNNWFEEEGRKSEPRRGILSGTSHRRKKRSTSVRFLDKEVTADVEKEEKSSLTEQHGPLIRDAKLSGPTINKGTQWSGRTSTERPQEVTGCRKFVRNIRKCITCQCCR